MATPSSLSSLASWDPSSPMLSGLIAARQHDPRLSAHCEPVDGFLLQVSISLRTCIPTYLAAFSTLFGYLSILSWLFAQLPQIYKNYQIRSTAGLSPWFLLEWLLGDASNLIGAVLTHQAAWQVVIGAYYSFVDCVLVGQYVWYERMGRGRKVKRLVVRGGRPPRRDQRGGPSSESEPLLANGHAHGYDHTNGLGQHPISRPKGKPAREQNGQANPTDAPFSSFHFPILGSPQREEETGADRPSGRSVVRAVGKPVSPMPSPHTVLLIACLCAALGRAIPLDFPPPSSSSITSGPTITDAHETASELAGRIISWLSTFLYLVSRLPQLYKNFRRKSTAGLSPALFAAAFSGNLFYSSSMLTNPLAWSDYGPYGHRGWAGAEGSSQVEWVLSALPFFLGAFGVLFLDGAVGVQFLIYGDGSKRRGMGVAGVPVLIETPPTRSAGPGAASTAEPPGHVEPRSRVLAVPVGANARGAIPPGDGWEGPSSWQRVSGWMRGWVPSFSPETWNSRRGSYMPGFSAPGVGATPSIGRSGRTTGTATPTDIGGRRSRSISRIRHQAEAWDRRTRDGDIDDVEPDDRPLLERDDIGGGSGEYGSL